VEAGSSTDWAACLVADERTRDVILEFLVLDRVGRLLSDEGGSAEAGSSTD
jgi:hypothetical protein